MEGAVSGRAARSAARAAARSAEPAGAPAASDEKAELPELNDEPADENPTAAGEKPAAALPLVEQVARIKEQLGIEAATLPEAVQQANAVMGLAGGGALPAQVEVLTAAIGLGQNEQPANADAQTGQHRCGCAVLSIWGNASWPMDMWSAHVIAVPAYFLKP